ncbi:MAG: D-amino acid dehydrogenase [Steroidobacteraceae bacterium]|nr:D-amino acid dehydrogenase [Steroidobacteraceae bacterium]
MKVIVLGGGVIGVTTAYYLASAGAEVLVVERQPGVALEASFANAGQVSPGYSTPWAAPDIPIKALKWLFLRHAPLAVRPDGSLFQLQWLASMLRNCTARRYAVNKERMMRVAEYSRHCLQQLRADISITYEERTAGTLQLFRSQAQLDSVARDVEVLRECGVPFELLDRAGLVRVEPGLAQARIVLMGGLRLPNDETGDCYLFTTRLAERARALGVVFRHGVAVRRLRQDAGKIDAVELDTPEGELLRADCYVLACGSYTRALLQPLGLRIPVYPVKGYSLTIPMHDESRAPVSTVLDETYKVALTRFERRIRVGGMAELAGFDLRLGARRRATLEKVTDELFPGNDLAAAEFWTGLRPMTPDGTPIIGATHYDNLFLNTGHGTLGWTMGCGSGKLLADLITGRRPAIDVDGLALSRYPSARSGRGLTAPSLQAPA